MSSVATAVHTASPARAERMTFLNDQLITRVYAAASALRNASKEVTAETIAEQARLPLARVKQILGAHPDALSHVEPPKAAAPNPSVVESLIACMDANRQALALESRILAALPPVFEPSRPEPSWPVVRDAEVAKTPWRPSITAFVGVGVVAAAIFVAMAIPPALALTLAGAAATLGAGAARSEAKRTSADVARDRFYGEMNAWKAEQAEVRAQRGYKIPLAAFQEVEPLRAKYEDSPAVVIIEQMRHNLARNLVKQRPGEMTPVAEGRLRAWGSKSPAYGVCAYLAGEVLRVTDGESGRIHALGQYLLELHGDERKAVAEFLREYFFDGEVSRFPMPHEHQVELVCFLDRAVAKG